MSVYGWSFELDSCNVHIENELYVVEFRVYGLFWDSTVQVWRVYPVVILATDVQSSVQSVSYMDLSNLLSQTTFLFNLWIVFVSLMYGLIVFFGEICMFNIYYKQALPWLRQRGWTYVLSLKQTVRETSKLYKTTYYKMCSSISYFTHFKFRITFDCSWQINWIIEYIVV